jgi:hypothetical protein
VRGAPQQPGDRQRRRTNLRRQRSCLKGFLSR